MRTLLRHSIYASGNFGKSTLWSCLEVFGLFYFTDALNLNPAIAGTILWLSFVWDSVSDPLVGTLADRYAGRVKTARPYVITGAIIAGLSFITLFALHRLGGGGVGLIFLVLILFRTGYTLVDVPHNAMLALITPDNKARSLIASLRIGFSGLGKLVMSLLAAILLTQDHPKPEEFETLALALAGIYVASVLISLIAYHEVALTQRKPENHHTLTRLVKIFTQNRRLISIFTISALTSLTTPVIGSILIYWGAHGPFTLAISMKGVGVLALSQMVALSVWTALNDRVLPTFKTAMLANTVVLLAALALCMVGGMSSAHSVSAPLAYSLISVMGFGLGGVFMLNWVLLPRAIDNDPLGEAKDYTLSLFGLFTLTNKLFMGFSSQISGLVLKAWGYSGENPSFESVVGMGQTLLTLTMFGALGVIVLLALSETKPRAPLMKRTPT
ncbi:MFS transporter [Woodsholea maritima]|uniref:MFS transporter n=1 Tax=Woodsholea maritima TaxID=240237 RepID=UPI00037850BE|nr:MFS transporter [Woodsholea maritima]